MYVRNDSQLLYHGRCFLEKIFPFCGKSSRMGLEFPRKPGVWNKNSGILGGREFDNDREKVLVWAKEQAKILTEAEKNNTLSIPMERSEGKQGSIPNFGILSFIHRSCLFWQFLSNDLSQKANYRKKLALPFYQFFGLHKL